MFQDRSYLRVEKVYCFENQREMSVYYNILIRKLDCITYEMRPEKNFPVQGTYNFIFLKLNFFENYPIELRVLSIHIVESLTFVFLAEEFLSTLK